MDAKRDQLTLDFTSRRNELLALVSGLSRHPLIVEQGAAPMVLSRGRTQGVIDLLRRLLVLADELPSPGQPQFVHKSAQVIYLAAAMHGFRVVSERTIGNWRRDAVALGVLSVDVRNHDYGGRERNVWSVVLDRLRELACNGLQRPATVSAPGPATISAPGPEMVAAPPIQECIQASIQPPPPDSASVERVDAGWASAQAVVAGVLKDPTARERASSEARRRGLSSDDVLSLAAYYRANASAFRSAGILAYVLRHAPPGCADDPGRHFPSLPPQAAAKAAETHQRERDAERMRQLRDERDRRPTPEERRRMLAASDHFLRSR